MSTRSLLIAAEPGPEARIIYCHQDSHIYELGRILSRHYIDPAKVRNLFRHGDAVTIAPTVRGSKFFRRDLGRPRSLRTAPGMKEALESFDPGREFDIEYVYQYAAAGRWAVSNPGPEGLTEPAPVNRLTMALETLNEVNPEFQEETLLEICQGNPAEAFSLKNAALRLIPPRRRGPESPLRRPQAL